MKQLPSNTVSADHKSINFRRQKQKFYSYLYSHTVTCTAASKALDIPQKNLTRYKRRLERAGVLWVVRRGICPVTGFTAGFLTTNPIIGESLKSC